jgi:hypothetical protein
MRSNRPPQVAAYSAGHVVAHPGIDRHEADSARSLVTQILQRDVSSGTVVMQARVQSGAQGSVSCQQTKLLP